VLLASRREQQAQAEKLDWLPHTPILRRQSEDAGWCVLVDTGRMGSVRFFGESRSRARRL
jgi:hypothetical protein